MKKILSFFIASAIAVSFSSCGDDGEEDYANGTETDLLVGDWYEEATNEEVRYSANGTYYDRYANWLQARETEGTWTCDYKKHKLTEFFHFNGQNQEINADLRSLSEFKFSMYTDGIGEHVYEKIVETYNMEVGKTQQIQFSNVSPVKAYKSNNDRLANVDSNGLITAAGEKGTTYIKLETSNGNVWVKVVVGDNCSDLWHDYVSIIGMDYATMSNTLRVLGEQSNIADSYSIMFTHREHDIIEKTGVFLCSEDNIVSEIQLVLREFIPEVKILNYMNSHYYKMVENNDYIFYSTSSDPDISKAIVAYDKADKKVIINETEHFFQRAHVNDLWEDFTGLFGKDKKAIEESMLKSGNMFLMNDFSYSDNGSFYYTISDNDYATMVGFVLNPDNLVSEYWIYMDMTKTAQTIYDYLKVKYYIEESENTDNILVFYNSDKTLRVTFDLKNGAVVYTDLTKKQHTHTFSMLGNFHKALGLNRYEIISQLGNPYMEEDNLMYYLGNDYVSVALISIDESKKICNSVLMMMNENVPSTTIIDFCNSQFTVFDKGTAEDGSQYAWIDGSSMAESKYGIIYVPEKRYVSYTLLNTTQSASKEQMEQMEKTIRDLLKMRVIKKGIQKHNQQKIQKISSLFK
ncbi:MAG: hypothetical protein J6C65_04040 [Prevotella sp.]|nr:hypothetical protein [Prevotella sp.]